MQFANNVFAFNIFSESLSLFYVL